MTAISLHDALDSIATLYDLHADELIEYAALDGIGGYHPHYDDGYPAGSIWRVEGQTLYALVRALRPRNVLEIGTYYGCSAAHIAQALADNGDGGTLTCIDLNAGVGSLIPPHLRDYVTIFREDLYRFLPLRPEGGYDFIFEDSAHTPEVTEFCWRQAYRLLAPGGMIVSHDAEHFRIGADVKAGIAQAGFFAATPPAVTHLIAPGDCGLAFWRKPVQVDYVPPEEKRKNDEVSATLPTVAELMQTPDLSAMTVLELKDFADKRGIALTGARTKGAIIASIEAVLS